MPRVTFVKAARKAKENYNIAVGDSYYWWKFMWGGKICSKTRPRPSQLTQSEYYGGVYSIQEQIEDLGEISQETLDELIEDIREIGEQCEEKHSNVPENLQYSEGADRLENRAMAMEEWADELESVEIPEEQDEPSEMPDFDECQNEDDCMEAQDAGDDQTVSYKEYIDALESALDEVKSFCPEIY